MQAGIVASTIAKVLGGKGEVSPFGFSIEGMIEKDLGPADEAEAAAIADRQLAAFQGIAARQEEAKRRKQEEPQRVLVPKGQEPPKGTTVKRTSPSRGRSTRRRGK